MYIQSDSEARSRNHRCRGNASINYNGRALYSCLTYPACKSQLFYTVFSSVACLTVPYFSTVSLKKHDLRRKNILNTTHVFRSSLQVLSKTFLILRKMWQILIINIRTKVFMYSNCYLC